MNKNLNVSDNIKAFDINLYIEFLEDRNVLYKELNEISELLISRQYGSDKKLNFELCSRVKVMLENRLGLFQQKYDVNYCHVNLIAVNFYRIVIGPCQWCTEHEFLTINLCD